MDHLWVRQLPTLGLIFFSIGPSYADVLSQDDALRWAREQNPEVLAAHHTWQVAVGEATEAGALPDPEFEIEYEGLPSIGSVGDFEERSIGIRQQIGWPGQWWHHRQAARHHADATRQSVFVATEIDIAARVRTRFGAVLHARDLLDHARRSTDLARDFLDRARSRHEAGDVPQLQVLRADVEVGRAENRVIETTQALDIERGRLNVLLGQPAGAELDVAGRLADAYPQTELDELQQLALARRPDLAAARSELESLRAARSGGRADLIPAVSVGVHRQTIRQPVGQDDLWRIGFGVEIPLSFASRQRGRMAAATARVDRARAELEGLRRRVGLEVRQATIQLAGAIRQAELYRDRILQEAELAQQAARRSYDAGKANYLEVLEAQQTLAEIRVEYTDRLFACHRAQAELNRAIGFSWPSGDTVSDDGHEEKQ